jgi:hypothetical protein
VRTHTGEVPPSLAHEPHRHALGRLAACRTQDQVILEWGKRCCCGGGRHRRDVAAMVDVAAKGARTAYHPKHGRENGGEAMCQCTACTARWGGAAGGAVDDRVGSAPEQAGRGTSICCWGGARVAVAGRLLAAGVPNFRRPCLCSLLALAVCACVYGRRHRRYSLRWHPQTCLHGHTQ